LFPNCLLFEEWKWMEHLAELDQIRLRKEIMTLLQNWVVVSNIFCFHPYLGKIPILTNIFQRGWNHQPEIVADVCLGCWFVGGADGIKVRGSWSGLPWRFQTLNSLRKRSLQYSFMQVLSQHGQGSSSSTVCLKIYNISIYQKRSIFGNLADKRHQNFGTVEMRSSPLAKKESRREKLDGETLGSQFASVLDPG